MFKKLRNKFLILNMTLISVLLISAFALVLAVSVRNADRELENMVHRNFFADDGGRMRGDRDPGLSFKPRGDIAEPPQNAENEGRPDMIENVSLRLDGDWNILEKRSPIEYSDSFYSQVIDGARAKYSGEPTTRYIKTENGYYKYMLSAYQNELGETNYSLNLAGAEAQITMLKNLTLTLSVVLLAALLLVFLISLFFANRAIRPIKEAWDKQNRFIADASHELKTPLTTINTNADVLLAHGDSTINSEKKWLMYIKDEAARMAELTGDLLYLARMDCGADDGTELAEISFSQAAESVILTYEAVIYEKNLSFTDEVEDDVYILGDESRIKQLVLILLDNAVKYTETGGEISLSLKKAEGKARLTVRNSCEKPLDDEKIFDRFYREDESRARSAGGYGLGLAIAKSITELHKGTIKLANLPGAAEFTAEIPLSR